MLYNHLQVPSSSDTRCKYGRRQPGKMQPWVDQDGLDQGCRTHFHPRPTLMTNKINKVSCAFMHTTKETCN